MRGYPLQGVEGTLTLLPLPHRRWVELGALLPRSRHLHLSFGEACCVGVAKKMEWAEKKLGEL
jgi:hypothetical protein